MLTLAAFLLIALLIVAACEATRGQFVRRLTDQDLRPVSSTEQGKRS